MTVAVPCLPYELARICAVRTLEACLAESGGADLSASDPVFRSFSIDGELQATRIQPRVVTEVLRRAGFKKVYTINYSALVMTRIHHVRRRGRFDGGRDYGNDGTSRAAHA